MKEKIPVLIILFVVFTVLLISCANPDNPFIKTENAKIFLAFKDSKNQPGANLSVKDTVGNTIEIGVCPYLNDLIDSVSIVVVKYRNDADSVIRISTFPSDVDTQWFSFSFLSKGIWTMTAYAYIQGGTILDVPGLIQIYGKTVSADIEPATLSKIEDEIATFSVAATGDEPFAYQWFHGETELNGETGVSYVKNHLVFADSGKYTCFVTDKWGDTVTSQHAVLYVVPKTAKANSRPALSVASGHSQILATETCSLSVLATDADTGQTLTYDVIKAPANYSFANRLFTWAPPVGYLGTDTIRIDSAVFIATDNGIPPLTDTLRIAIEVRSKILPPDSVKGLIPVSRTNGSFVFKWGRSLNADMYDIYRSTDSINFSKYTTVSDTFYSNAIKDTVFYYYVVATNSKGTAAATSLIRSLSINSAPQWKHQSINVTINEGSSFSIDLADSVSDVNGDKISLQLQNGDPANDSLSGMVWKYAPSYNDSGLKSVKIKAADALDSSILTIALHVVNVPRPPQPQAQSLSTNRNTALQITLSAVSPDGEAVTSWTIDTQSTHGTAVLTSASLTVVTYTPGSGFMGTDYFTFKASIGSLSSAYSAKVSIKVDTNKIAPRVLTPISSQTKNVNDSVAFTVTINSDVFPAPEYSWYKAGTLIVKNSQNSLKKTSLTLADSGLYYLIVANDAGRDSSGARLTMQKPPTISPKLAATTTVNAGGTTPISVTVNSDAMPAPTYKWFINNSEISGATTNSYSKTWAAADTGTYKVIVSNPAGSDTTFTKLNIRVAPSGLSYSTNPAAYTIAVAITPNTANVTGVVDSFSVSSPLPAGLTLNKSTGTITGTPTTASGPASYTVTAWNQAGSATVVLSISVLSPPHVTPLADTTRIIKGAAASLTATATGSAPINYVWKRITPTISQVGTAASYSKTWSAYADSGMYRVIATNSAGSDSSSTIVVIRDVTRPDAILKGSTDTTILLSTTATFSDFGLASANDDRDGSVLNTASIISNSVNLKSNGRYLVKWQVSDLSGNKDTVTRNVKVTGWEKLDTTTVASHYFQMRMTTDSTLYVASLDTTAGKPRIYKLVGKVLQEITPQISKTNVVDLSFALSNDGQIIYLATKERTWNSGTSQYDYSVLCQRLPLGGAWQAVGTAIAGANDNDFIDVAVSKTNSNKVSLLVLDTIYQLTINVSNWYASIVGAGAISNRLAWRPLHVIESGENGSMYFVYSRSMTGIVVRKQDSNGNWGYAGADSVISLTAMPIPNCQVAFGTKVFASNLINTQAQGPYFWRLDGTAWTDIGSFPILFSNTYSLAAPPDRDIPYFLHGLAGEIIVQKYSGGNWVPVPEISGNGRVLFVSSDKYATMAAGKSGVSYAASVGSNGKLNLLKCQE